MVCLGSLLAVLVAGQEARAQTVAPTQNNQFPVRIVNGQPVMVQCTTSSTGVCIRPENLNPQGISYSDCVEDMSLQFSVTLSGFSGQAMQIWASKSSDCTAPADRGIGPDGNPCWNLGQGVVGQPSIDQPLQFTIRVQDIVGLQNASAPVVSYQRQGVSACSQQPTFSAVPIYVNFVPLDTTGALSGTGYKYQQNSDLVGPPAPRKAQESVGNTLFNVTWTTNTDADTTGYDIFIDPYPGMEGAETSFASPEPIEVCPDTGAPVEASDDASIADAEIDGAPTDAMASMTGAACHTTIVGGSGGSADGSSLCNNSVLSGSISPDAGTALTTTSDSGESATGDDSGDASVGLETGNGGISTVPQSLQYNPTIGTGATVSDESDGQYTIKGLRNGTPYTVVVSAVDAYGNIGPPSGQVCDSPAPTQDFWDNYVADHGGAGGGFCALDAVGAPLPSLAGTGFLVSAIVLSRRRKRPSR